MELCSLQSLISREAWIPLTPSAIKLDGLGVAEMKELQDSAEKHNNWAGVDS